MRFPLASVLAALALFGCDSDDDGGPSGSGSGVGTTGSAIDAGDATLLGLVSVERVDDPLEPEGTDAVSASFLRFPSSDRLEAILARIRPETGTCNLTRFDDAAQDVPDPELVGVDESIDAGEVIVFSSPAGTWYELTRADDGDGLEYRENDALPGPAPAGLVVDIPGADFPAFAAVAVPAVTPFADLVPESSDSVMDTFRWTAADDSSSVVTFAFAALDDDDSSTGTQGFCVTEDDGEFSFPANVIEAVGSGAGDSFGVTVTRESLDVERRDGALLLTFQASEG